MADMLFKHQIKYDLETIRLLSDEFELVSKSYNERNGIIIGKMEAKNIPLVYTRKGNRENCLEWCKLVYKKDLKLSYDFSHDAFSRLSAFYKIPNDQTHNAGIFLRKMRKLIFLKRKES